MAINPCLLWFILHSDWSLLLLVNTHMVVCVCEATIVQLAGLIDKIVRIDSYVSKLYIYIQEIKKQKQ